MNLSKIRPKNQYGYKKIKGFKINDRQLYIFKLLASGYNVKEIALIQGCCTRAIHYCIDTAIKNNRYSTYCQIVYFLSKNKLI